jgi:hypothetical protein
VGTHDPHEADLILGAFDRREAVTADPGTGDDAEVIDFLPFLLARTSRRWPSEPA